MSTSENNQYDTIEVMIYEENLRIEAVDIHPDLDIMIVILNTKAILHQNLSAYKNLSKGNKASLMEYELIAGGIGVHWPQLDEDLSLKGFLQEVLRKMVKSDKDTLAA